MLRTKNIGPVYVGYEASTPERKVVSRAWFRNVAPPWRNGRGIRFRFGTRAIQVGICHTTPQDEPTALSQLGGYELPLSPQEIGAWGKRAATTEEDPT